MDLEILRKEVEKNKGKIMRLFHRDEPENEGSFFSNFMVLGGMLYAENFVGEYEMNPSDVDRVSFLSIEEICKLASYGILCLKHVEEKASKLIEEIESAKASML